MKLLDFCFSFFSGVQERSRFCGTSPCTSNPIALDGLLLLNLLLTTRVSPLVLGAELLKARGPLRCKSLWGLKHEARFAPYRSETHIIDKNKKKYGIDN